MTDLPRFVTCTAPVNIAVIKYWGKSDEERIIPVNSSLSVTLNQDSMRSLTTVMASRKFKEDQMWVNGVYVFTQFNVTEMYSDHPLTGRVKRVLTVLRSLAQTVRDGDDVVIDQVLRNVHALVLISLRLIGQTMASAFAQRITSRQPLVLLLQLLGLRAWVPNTRLYT